MAFYSVFVNGILISFMSEQVVGMPVAHRQERSRFVQGAERICDLRRNRRGPLHFDLQFQRRPAGKRRRTPREAGKYDRKKKTKDWHSRERRSFTLERAQIIQKILLLRRAE